ncbi:hypothetical protein CERZMDRAFT_94815 [Cercospora zeae-maydis SCOH1-5]|uniref:Uncharacterized protein n=1 Tax=Cercospora zeae-maydis SCOH1-5 TaxID=717836 RepID=A0A6A6FQ32_9PEZI|nr:hypothetical protein CERZMDRAFT_94815 [Cercospora zeae-maydis SCOH1-5]
MSRVKGPQNHVRRGGSNGITVQRLFCPDAAFYGALCRTQLSAARERRREWLRRSDPAGGPKPSEGVVGAQTEVHDPDFVVHKAEAWAASDGSITAHQCVPLP